MELCDIFPRDDPSIHSILVAWIYMIKSDIATSLSTSDSNSKILVEEYESYFYGEAIFVEMLYFSSISDIFKIVY